MSKFLDFILYPKAFYEKLTDKNKRLFWCISLIGLIDIILFGLVYNIFIHFSNGTPGDYLINAFILIASVFILGFLDVFFVALPLSDIFHRFSPKANVLKKQSARIIFMKAYICSHFIIAPVSALVSILFRNITVTSSTLVLLCYILLETLVMVWSAALLTRGAKVIFGYSNDANPPVFLAIFFWSNIIVGRVLFFILNSGIIKLLR
jgi:hypothetical protein